MKVKTALLAGAAAFLVGGAAYALRQPGEGEPLSPLPSPTPPTGPSGISATPNEVEALGRVVASEARSATPSVQRAIAWVARNRFRGKSIYKKQYPWRSQRGVNPPFSSERPATDETREIAREVILADQSIDPTGGATAFFEPKLQDALAKAGAMARAGQTGKRVIDGVKISDITRFKAYTKDAAAVRRGWSSGSVLYATAGPFELWGSARGLARRDGKVLVIAGYGVVGGDPRPEMCPTCSEKWELQCLCSLGDRQCRNGHHWHLCPEHGTLVLKKAPHDRPVRCTCGKFEPVVGLFGIDVFSARVT